MKKHVRNTLYSALVLPGLGQFANKHKLKGTVFVVLTLMASAGLIWNIVNLFSYYIKALQQISEVTAVYQGQPLDEKVIIQMFKALLLWMGALLVIWGTSTADAWYYAKRIYPAYGDSSDINQ